MLIRSKKREWLVTRAAAGMAMLAGAASATPSMERAIIGHSGDGTPIEAWTIADAGAGTQPAIAVIAGVQGHHQIGPTVAEAMARVLVDDYAEALSGRTVYIIPRVNPDGLARFTSPRAPRALSGRAPQPRDADGDRRTDEDPPNDLNGDGLITMMRVPAPNTAFGLEATHVIDAEDSRILSEPGDEEIATHAILIEGIDDDGDGRFNEDGWGGASGGGIDLDLHFPTHWPEHTDGAGRFPLERPEARAVVEWLQARGNIAAVIVLGPHDTIVTTPPTGRYGPDGRVPLGIEEDDASAYSMAADAFKEITGITKTEPGPQREGSLLQWCYADLGVYAFGTPVWVRPDLVSESEADPDAGEREAAAEGDTDEDAEPTAEEIEAADRADLAERGVGQTFIDFLYMDAGERATVVSEMQTMSESELQSLMQQFSALPADVQGRLRAIQTGAEDPGPSAELLASIGAGGDGGASASGGSDGVSGDAKWLAWIDENAEGGFVDWQPHDHPQLGRVEIGGFVPGVRVNPPTDQEGRLAEQQSEFAAALLEMLPSLEIQEPTVEAVGGGVWRVGLTLRNSGKLPTKSAIGVKSRRLPGVVCVLDPDQDLETPRIISGPRAIRFATIEGHGGSERAEWLVIAEAGDAIDLEVRSPLLGANRYELTLENN